MRGRRSFVETFPLFLDCLFLSEVGCTVASGVTTSSLSCGTSTLSCAVVDSSATFLLATFLSFIGLPLRRCLGSSTTLLSVAEVVDIVLLINAFNSSLRMFVFLIPKVLPIAFSSARLLPSNTSKSCIKYIVVDYFLCDLTT